MIESLYLDNLISKAGCNLISKSGYNLISKADCNLISKAGYNLISKAGCNLISNLRTLVVGAPMISIVIHCYYSKIKVCIKCQK